MAICDSVWIGGLPSAPANALRERLTELANSYGRVLNVRVAAGESPFAFVIFENYEAAGAMIEDNGMTLDGARLTIRPKIPQAERTVFVVGLDFNCSESELLQCAEPYGRVQYLNIACEPSGRSRGFAHIAMTTQEEAANLIDALEGREWNGRILHAHTSERRPVVV
jgi:hypothetical protein